MTSRISHTSVDAIDAYAQSVWWSKVLDFVDEFCVLPPDQATSSPIS
jgi:hypothetical protein